MSDTLVQTIRKQHIEVCRNDPTGYRRATVNLTVDQGFQLLEEVKGSIFDSTVGAEKKALIAVVLENKDEDRMIEMLNGSTLYGMKLKVHRMIEVEEMPSPNWMIK